MLNLEVSLKFVEFIFN